MKKILNEILKEPYYNNYFENMEQYNQTELIEILKNTLNTGYYCIIQNLKKIDYENLNNYDKNYFINQIDNSKAIFILNYLIQTKN